jgi:nucleotide-binding universal stress UspA family protein
LQVEGPGGSVAAALFRTPETAEHQVSMHKDRKERIVNTEIVVGVDGSAPSHVALRWAAEEARRRSARLLVIHAHEWPWPGAPLGPVNTTAPDSIEQQARQLVADAIAEAKGIAPTVPVEGRAVSGVAAAALLEAARGAALLVVGDRGRGGFARLLLGSVSTQVANHAEGPVAVVRGDADRSSYPIIVGVDGSPGSEAALGVAFEEAVSRGCGLVAIHAWAAPNPPWGVDVPPVAYDREAIMTADRQSLADAVAPWTRKYPTVPVEERLARGDAREVLTAVSQNAQLVVVGSRSQTALAGRHAGSVSRYLLHHAACPVLLVHTPERNR